MEIEKDIKKQYRPFEKFPLKPDLVADLKKCKYFKPYDIQEKALDPMIKGHDVFIQSSCASGKTSLSIMTALQLIDVTVNKCQALILYPRRYTAQAAREMAIKIGQRMDLKAVALVGGVSLEDQKRELREGASLVLGTPGRIYDVLEQDGLILKDLRLIIVEDCDEMFDFGFEEMMKKIFKFVPPDVQMCIFASHCSAHVRRFNEFCLRNPVYISKYSQPEEMKDFEHFKFQVEKEEDKVEFSIKLHKKMDRNIKSIIYCNKFEDLEKLVQVFEGNNLNVIAIDPNMSQVERHQSALRFMESSVQILVTINPLLLVELHWSDNRMLLIINFDVPESRKEYENNLGGEFPFSKKEVIINIFLPSEAEKIRNIEEYSLKINEVSLDDFVKHLKEEQEKAL